jgi:ribosomal-protein-alanine N-acetyltransferase
VVATLLHTEAPPEAFAFAADGVETARLRLRLFTPGDLDRMCEITRDPEVMRYIGHGHPFSREETRANLGRIMDRFRRRGYGRWAMERRDTGALIGYCGLSSGNPEVGIEVAYMLAREEWGKGFALEAGRAALRYGFETLGVNSIAGITIQGNSRSCKVLGRLGMTFVRNARYYEFHCTHYSIARADWRDAGSFYRVIQGSRQ